MKTAYLFIMVALMGCAPAFAQTTVNNLKTNVLSLTKQGSTPSNAATGTLKLYGKSNDKLYTLTSGGSETEIGPMSFGAVGSSPSANGATVSGTTITLQPASGTLPGLMLAGSQTLGGAKTWNGGQNLASFLEFDSAAAPATTGDDVTLASPTKVTNVLADDALNSIAGITGPGNARMAFYVNSAGENIIIRNNSGSAGVGDKIITGTATDYTLADGSSVLLIYDTAVGVWRITGGPGPVTGVIPVANGGTGQTSKAAAFDALSPMTTAGDLIYGGSAGAATRLANGSSGQFLKSNGGTSAPSWATAPVRSLDSSTVIINTIAVISSNTTITVDYDVIYCNTTSGNVTLTFPAVASHQGKKIRVIKSAAANSCILDGNSTETFAAYGGSSQIATLYLNQQTVEVVSNNASWNVISTANDEFSVSLQHNHTNRCLRHVGYLGFRLRIGR
jgi:hypothetical protein